jgi:YD repeat-containing protein
LILTLIPAAGLRPNSPLAPRVARAEAPAPDENRADVWPALSEPVIIEKGPDHYPTQGLDGADPNMITTKPGTTDLTFHLPGAWTPDLYKEADVAFQVAPAESPTSWQTVQEQAYPVTAPPKYSLGDSAYKDGLYLWTYTATPVAAECPPPADQSGEPTDPPSDPSDPPAECPTPDLMPATGEEYPLIIDRERPEVTGLRTLGDGHLGLDVRDAVGLAKIHIAAGASGGTPYEFENVLTGAPRRVMLPLEALGAYLRLDFVITVTVTDLVGNTVTENLPLQPFVRTPQFGTGGPWLSAQQTVGGLPQAVNLVTGNGYFAQTDLSIPVFSVSLDVSRAYNHQNRQQGLLGWGWKSSLDMNLDLWDVKADTLQGVAAWEDASGTEYLFDLHGSGEVGAIVDGIAHAWPRLAASASGYVLRLPTGESLRFDSTGRLQAIRDVNGTERVTYVYDKGQLTSVQTSVSGLYLSLNVENGLLQEVHIHRPDRSADQTITYQYDNGNLTGVTGLYGRTAEYTYDDLHRLHTMTFPFTQGDETLRSKITWEYGNGSRVLQVSATRSDVDPDHPTEPIVEKRDFKYFTDGPALSVDVTDPRGTTTYEADRAGRPWSVARPVGTETLTQQFEFVHHNLSRMVDGNGRQTLFTYNDKDDLTLIRQPDGRHRVRYTYTYTYAGTDPYRMESLSEEQVLADSFDDPAESGTLLSTTRTEFAGGWLPVSVKGPFGEGEGTTYYSYENGLLSSVWDPLHYLTCYAYDNPLSDLLRLRQARPDPKRE